MRWTDLETRQPRLADVARRRLVEPGVLLVVTIRADGSPRLSPGGPWLMDGDLWLGMLWKSLKAQDLLRDPRLLVHSLVTSRDGEEGEVKVRGRAVVDDGSALDQYTQEVSAQLGWSPTPGRFHLFRVDIEHVAYLRYVDASGDQYVASWPPPKEHLRRGQGGTALGEAVPMVDLLLPE